MGSFHKSEYQKTSIDNQANMDFKPTKKIGNVIAVDEIHQRWQLLDGFGKCRDPQVYKYDDIKELQLLEDEETALDSILRGAARGSLGGSTTGAIYGAVRGYKEAYKFINSLNIRIMLHNPEGAVLFIPLLNDRTERDTYAYKSRIEIAQQIMSIFSPIGISDESQQKSQPSEDLNNVLFSAADEILKFKGLLDKGIITQEEFDAKKKQLLNI